MESATEPTNEKTIEIILRVRFSASFPSFFFSFSFLLLHHILIFVCVDINFPGKEVLRKLDQDLYYSSGQQSKASQCFTKYSKIITFWYVTYQSGEWGSGGVGGGRRY